MVGLGEELWKKFLPKYLEPLGASVAVVGLFGTMEDFLDALYQYPGGWLADHWGRRRAFLTFLVAALAGYLIYLISPSWPFLFLGLVFATAWQSMASPAIFATVGDALPRERRAMGRFPKRHSSRPPDHYRLCGSHDTGPLGNQYAHRFPGFHEAAESLEFVSLRTQTAACFRYCHSYMRRKGRYFCRSLRHEHYRANDSAIRNPSRHTTCNGTPRLYPVLKVG